MTDTIKVQDGRTDRFQQFRMPESGWLRGDDQNGFGLNDLSRSFDITGAMMMGADASRKLLTLRHQDALKAKGIIIPSADAFKDLFSFDPAVKTWGKMNTEERLSLLEGAQMEFGAFFQLVSETEGLANKDAILKDIIEVMQPLEKARSTLQTQQHALDLSTRLLALTTPVADPKTLADKLHNLTLGDDVYARSIADKLQSINIFLAGKGDVKLSDGRTLVNPIKELLKGGYAGKLPEDIQKFLDQYSVDKLNDRQLAQVAQSMFETLQTDIASGSLKDAATNMKAENVLEVPRLMGELADKIKDKYALASSISYTPEADKLGSSSGLPLTLTKPAKDAPNLIDL
ncbi:MAG: hypothetical protein MRY32_09930 [Rickettsiales bacterium]|nr:hypothetical protein [Rickettsiales bacterium]